MLSESEDVVNIGDYMEFNDEYLNTETHLTPEFVTLVFKNKNIHEHLKATIAENLYLKKLQALIQSVRKKK